MRLNPCEVRLDIETNIKRHIPARGGGVWARLGRLRSAGVGMGGQSRRFGGKNEGGVWPQWGHRAECGRVVC